MTLFRFWVPRQARLVLEERVNHQVVILPPYRVYIFQFYIFV